MFRNRQELTGDFAHVLETVHEKMKANSGNAGATPNIDMARRVHAQKDSNGEGFGRLLARWWAVLRRLKKHAHCHKNAQ